MTDENTGGTGEGISEAELKEMVGSALDEKLEARGLTADVLKKLNVLDGLEGLFEKHKSGGDREGLLSEIGDLIDKKLGALSGGGSGSGNGGGTGERKPRLKIFQG